LSGYKIHPDFKLNGVAYCKEALTAQTTTLLKQEAKFQNVLGHFLLDWLQPSEEIIVQTSGSTGVCR